MSLEKKIAHLSMEVGLKREIPTYSGGLGILAGDSIKAAADLNIPMVAVTLIYKKGNSKQKLWPDGWQDESDVVWHPEEYMKKLEIEVEIKLRDKPVKINAWQYNVEGVKSTVPVYFLDADNPSNMPEIREATNHVYGGGDSNRFYQEAILGIAGVRLLDKLGIEVSKYHLNEGHSAFLIPELINKGESLDEILNKCVCTTHTPVRSGLQRFDYNLVENILRDYLPDITRVLAGHKELDMTLLALNCSGYVNAVSKKHSETVSRMFDRNIDYITNGVHSATWTSKSFQELYDKYCEGWRENAEKLKEAKNIPLEEIWNAHMIEKKAMIDFVNSKAKTDLNPEILTIGFARRMVRYKRPELMFNNSNELLRIASGKLQLIFAGKTHQDDKYAKDMLKEVFSGIQKLGNNIKCAYLEDYNIDLAKLLTSGCDIWLNNPLPPLEACGTSGMKAAHNAIPQLSTLDGWWLEGCKENVTGLSIGNERNISYEINPESPEAQAIKQEDAKSLYEKLENIILPEYYSKSEKFKEIMRNTVAINASYFNTHRMMKEYAEKAYKIKI